MTAPLDTFLEALTCGQVVWHWTYGPDGALICDFNRFYSYVNNLSDRCGGHPVRAVRSARQK